MHTARILGEVVIQISEGLQFVLNAYMAHILHRLETSRSRDEALVEPHSNFLVDRSEAGMVVDHPYLTARLEPLLIFDRTVKPRAG